MEQVKEFILNLRPEENRYYPYRLIWNPFDGISRAETDEVDEFI